MSLTLQRGTVIPNNKIKEFSGILNTIPKNFSEARNLVEIEQKLKNFFQLEIQRYFKEQRNDIVRLEAAMGCGLRIPSKTNELALSFIGLLFLFAIFGNFFMGTTSAKQDTYECAEKTGMGETVSREDIDNLDRCLREKGYFNQH